MASSRSVMDWLLIGFELRLNARLDKIQQAIEELKVSDAALARIRAATGRLDEQASELKDTVETNRPK